MTRPEIEIIVHECLQKLFTEDEALIINDVSERAITHKLAEYLQQRFPLLNVDCEYNRNAEMGENAPKSVQLLNRTAQDSFESTSDPEELLTISTYPDIIVHRRLTNEENLLVVEVKKTNSRVDHQHDHNKLCAFTENNKNNSYHFQYGVFILLDTGLNSQLKPEFTWYSEGVVV